MLKSAVLKLSRLHCPIFTQVPDQGRARRSRVSFGARTGTFDSFCARSKTTAGRDEIWGSPEAEVIKNAVWTESGMTLGSVDATFEYCLTRLGERFSKRDTLLATADLSRSFLVLVVFAAPAAIHIVWDVSHRPIIFLPLLLFFFALLALAGFLAWRRMVCFRRMSETGVFRAYLGSRPVPNPQDGVPEKVP